MNIPNKQDLATGPFDAKAFRAALGSYATGVTIITTCKPDGSYVGLTANSFNSVSLDPPLVLWSLSLYSSQIAVFQECSHYAINVLSFEQLELSKRFAISGIDKFAGLSVDIGVSGVPLLPRSAAWFECRNETRHSGGDHVIFVGLVERFSRTDLEPLGFLAGKYKRLADV
jgi:3-hydroxy-9,10-secoandrosta-1,3,5(10)-triene-9,17-dione monooxygenase reductase component